MRPKLLYKNSLAVAAMALAFLLVANSAFAQGSSFTYQGRLTDGGTVANGLYDLQFALFDSASSGAQIGSTQTLNSVLVSAGVFSVTLDFGANSFNGANRFLEISARLSGAGSFTLLTPRQQVTATPYAIRSVNASAADALSNACAGCVQDEIQLTPRTQLQRRTRRSWVVLPPANTCRPVTRVCPMCDRRLLAPLITFKRIRVQLRTQTSTFPATAQWAARCRRRNTTSVASVS